MIDLHIIETTSLGDRSYLASDGAHALVVDPQRDLDRVLALAGRLGVTITCVLETHLHNDYVSGGLALAQATGARYGVAADDRVGFWRVPLADGQELDVCEHLAVTAVHTPGHTFTHLSYVLRDRGEAAPAGVFTGGSLLFGTTGRTDLLGAEHAEALAYAQRESAHRLAALPPSTAVWPTHGFGSFCAAGTSTGDDSTIGVERRANPALTMEADRFVRETLAGLDAYPAYYAHMGAANAAGAALADLTPVELASADEVARRVRAGEWVVDLRHRTAYTAGHLAGTIGMGLDGSMATWLGWLAPWGAPITLLGDTQSDVAEAQRELVRIGIERPAAAASGGVRTWLGPAGALRSIPTTTHAGLARALAGGGDLPAPDVLVDVRLGNEWREGHLDRARHIPLPELTSRIDELPTGCVWVYCGVGYRATIAAGLIARAGREVVVVDDPWEHAADAGLAVVEG
jgi:glyoxylase-like metal-dependent hydrolase (beta-lactamase superfamily II)/rhodanese-related sulfurtransferase